MDNIHYVRRHFYDGVHVDVVRLELLPQQRPIIFPIILFSWLRLPVGRLLRLGHILNIAMQAPQMPHVLLHELLVFVRQSKDSQMLAQFERIQNTRNHDPGPHTNPRPRRNQHIETVRKTLCNILGWSGFVKAFITQQTILGRAALRFSLITIRNIWFSLITIRKEKCDRNGHECIIPKEYTQVIF
eukprot:2148949-Pyramimonas_sp.AAC.3